MTTAKAVLITVAGVFVMLVALSFERAAQTPVNDQVGKTFPNITITETWKPARPRYPYSLVPGGVHSIKELGRALMFPAFAKNFPGFDMSKAHIVHIYRLGYVSFLKDGKIGWTKDAQLLSEDVITDGKYFIRMRCGNGIVFTPQIPTIPSVTNEVLDTPELPPVSLIVPPEVTVQPVENPTISPVYAGGSPISGLGTPPLFIYIPPSGGGPPPIAVPEPSEWALAFLALNAILFTQFFKKRRK